MTKLKLCADLKRRIAKFGGQSASAIGRCLRSNRVTETKLRLSPNPDRTGSSFNRNQSLIVATQIEGAGRPSRLDQSAALRAQRGSIYQLNRTYSSPAATESSRIREKSRLAFTSPIVARFTLSMQKNRRLASCTPEKKARSLASLRMPSGK